MDALEAIMTRRTTREFADAEVEDDKVELLLRAAMRAPSAAKQRAWAFVVVRNRETLDRLARTDEYAAPLAHAPLCIVVLCEDARLQQPKYWQQELAAATQNILLAAAALGIGSVWMGVAPKEERVRYVGECFGLPRGVHAFAMIALGYPKEPGAGDGADSSEDGFDPSRIHREAYIG